MKRTVVFSLGCLGGLLLVASVLPARERHHIIEAITDNFQDADVEAAGSKGGSVNNKLDLVSSPTRAGGKAFKHWVNQKGERAELAMSRTEIGETYWYGWSMLLPNNFTHRGSDTIVMQLATWPSPRDGNFPCSANGPYLEIIPNGNMIFYLQHKGDEEDMVCDKFQIVDDVSTLKGRWIDFVMHAKWTGDKDGVFKFWIKTDEEFIQKINYKGRTWWNDEDTGPYFKMGAYMGEPGWDGPESRTVYTDEYRLGSHHASFDDVAPGNNE